MQVVILAGGLGMRLKPLTNQVPKALVMACGKPFLHYQLKWLASHGLREVVICVGHLADQIESFAKDGRDFGMRITYSREGDRLLGTGGALKQAEALLDEDFGVLNGDSYLPINPLDPMQLFRKQKSIAMMLTFRNRGRYDSSNVMVQNGFVTHYSRGKDTPGLEFIDYGLRMFRKEVLQLIPPETFYDLDGVYHRLIEQHTLAAYTVSQPFYEIGSPRGLARFSRYADKTRLCN
jgi:NDP-sugar pyrophosphorylase family protein